MIFWFILLYSLGFSSGKEDPELRYAIHHPLLAYKKFTQTKKRLAATGSISIFINNLKKAQELNKNSNTNVVYGITPFSDMTSDDFSKYYLGYNKQQTIHSRIRKRKLEYSYPSIDWRNISGNNYITSVKDQGPCGSCVAHSITAGLESTLLIKNLTSIPDIDLSERYIMECSRSEQICSGWYEEGYIDYIETNGYVLEQDAPYDYPDFYSDRILNCSALPSIKTPDLTSYQPSFFDVYSLLSFLQRGPVMVEVDASALQHYRSGIIDCKSSSSINHAALVVGYNRENDYFVVKNSWGTGWGMNGFFQVKATCLNIEGPLGMFTAKQTFWDSAPLTSTPTKPPTKKPTTKKPTKKPTWKPTKKPTKKQIK